jgi:hypothetical protein
VPRHSKSVDAREDVSEGAMRVAAFGRRSTLVNGSAHERVAELDSRFVDAHEIGVLGAKEVVCGHAQKAARGLDTGEVAGIIRRRNEQRSPCRFSEDKRSTSERSLDPRAQLQRLLQWCAPA